MRSFLFFAAAFSSNLREEFERFQVTYNKQYVTAAERTARFQIFSENMAKALSRNHENIAAGGTAVHGVNKFSDFAPSEFGSKCVSGMPKQPQERASGSVGNSGVLDWRTKGVVTDVEDEGQCGSTWAFSVKESIESFAATVGKHPLVKLSTQQIVACDQDDDGCCGGEPDVAFKYVIKAGGLETDVDYPYTSGNGTVDKCLFNKAKVKISFKNFTMVAPGEQILHSVLSLGPPSACVSAESWQTYTGGIMTSCLGTMDHCVQVVGYDDTHSPPYWIVRNQWGTDWGEKGYIRIAQGNDVCLIGDLVSHPNF